MYQSFSQEPRYKHSLYEREPRHVESKEFFEEYTSSSEEEEESSEKTTEESDEETTESQESQERDSLHKTSEWRPAFEQQWSYHKFVKPGKNIGDPYIYDTRNHMQDKVTQKNLLSPFPSFLIPPIPRQVTGGRQYYRMPNVRSPKEASNNIKLTIKHSPKKMKNYKEEEDYEEGKDLTCSVHRNYDQKPKVLVDQSNQSEICPADRALKCVHRESPEVPARNFSKPPAETEKRSKQPSFISKYIRRPKSSTRENVNNQQATGKFADITLERDARDKSRPKTATEVIPCEKDSRIREAFLARNIGDGKLANKKGEIKEKLVYVVEEEGKEVKKLETDLFTLNEILAIKRDLLELSEFAKKLKKLKEMKKESEEIKNKENACQCKPAEELLKDVNRRIEILEVRQEELERENTGAGQRGDIDTESKKTNATKISSKPPAVIQSTATTTDPSIPKTKIFVTKPEGSSNNSDIVKELMDIKTQLQRLEKRRISKEVSDEVGPEGSTKVTTNKNRAIAIFSSKTYIFAADNFGQKKIEEKMKRGEKMGKNCIPSEEKNMSKNERRRANVARWLKDIKIDPAETDVSMLISLDRFKRRDNGPKELKGNSNLKCRTCNQTLRTKDFKLEEQGKNGMLESDERKGDNRFAKLLKKNISMSDINQCVGDKKCVMTPSRRLFAIMSQSSEKVLNVPSARCAQKPSPGSNAQWLPPRTVIRGRSSESITSAILVKQQARRLKARTPAEKHCKELMPSPSRSRSLQDVSLSSNFGKIEKLVQDMKSFGKGESSLPLRKAQKKKEGKNNFVQDLEAHLVALKKNYEKCDDTLSSSSEFIASMNLSSEKSSAVVESGTLQKNMMANNEIYAYTALRNQNYKDLDLLGLRERSHRDGKKMDEKRQKERKEEKKKEKKESELNKKTKGKKEKKHKDPTKQKKCKKSKKKKELHCECKNTKYSNIWKSYYANACLKCNEDKLAYDCPKIIEDNFKLYGKRQTGMNETNLDSKKSIVDSFTIRNILKNLGRYYPKISNFHIFPFCREELPDQTLQDPTKPRHSKTRIANGSEDRVNKDDGDDEGNRDDDGESQSRDGSYRKSSDDREHRDYYLWKTKQEDLRNCRCVQVYLQTLEQQGGWSGLGPFGAMSECSVVSDYSSKSAESVRSRKTDSVYSSQIHCMRVSKGNPKCDKKCEKKCAKKYKKEKKQKHKKCKSCNCCKCGNMHKLNRKNMKKKCVEECMKKIQQQCSNQGSSKHCKCNEKSPSGSFPFFSFFSNIRKPRSRDSKFSKSIINKLSEVRYLKTCPRVKTNFFSKLRNQVRAPSDHKNVDHKRNRCHCVSKFKNIEKKLKELEKSCCKKEKKKKEKKKEKEKKKKCHCDCSCESKRSGPATDCWCCEGKEKKKKEKKSKKEKCKKCMKKRCRSECKDNDHKSTGAYYLVTDGVPSDVTSGSEGSTHKTTEEDEKFPYVVAGPRELKEKLPSLACFLEDIQRYKGAKCPSGMKKNYKRSKKSGSLFEPGVVFTGDCPRSGSRFVKEDPMVYYQELKKREKKLKEKEGKKRKKTAKPQK